MSHRLVAVRLSLAALLFLAGVLSLPSTWATGLTEIEKQRQLFNAVFETVERGDWSVVDDLPAADSQLLQKYVLWPDLRATF